jgi:hypothetical protein
MKLTKTKKGTFTLQGITETQLKTLFYPHNYNPFYEALPELFKTASNEIYQTLNETAYKNEEEHLVFVTATKTGINNETKL